MRFGHNFWLGGPIDTRSMRLNCILQDLFRDTPLDHIWPAQIRAQVCIFRIFGHNWGRVYNIILSISFCIQRSANGISSQQREVPLKWSMVHSFLSGTRTTPICGAKWPCLRDRSASVSTSTPCSSTSSSGGSSKERIKFCSTFTHPSSIRTSPPNMSYCNATKFPQRWRQHGALNC